MQNMEEYEAFSRNSDMYTADIAALPSRQRSKFYHTVRQTFAALRLHPYYARVLQQPQVKRAIEREARRFMIIPRHTGRCPAWYGVIGKPFDPTHDLHERYLLGNISRADPFIEDVTDTLHWLQTRDAKYPPRPLCMPRGDVEAFRSSAAVPGQVDAYIYTHIASAIARNAFLLGWERRMRSICRDYAAEVAEKRPPNHHLMRAFLASVEGHLDTCSGARLWGLPLSVLPRHLKLAE
jgi:hypothetical protein